MNTNYLKAPKNWKDIPVPGWVPHLFKRYPKGILIELSRKTPVNEDYAFGEKSGCYVINKEGAK
tara:strand:- start:200 stop:391 length:192 start_codon:yes stop_codon:yes gene_type:complete